MKLLIRILLVGCIYFLVTTSFAVAGQAAARVGDMTNHGGTIVPPGATTVFIGNKVAARRGDYVECPIYPHPEAPHIGGLIIQGSNTVMIEGKLAARVGDQVQENGVLSIISTGDSTVFIGN